MKNTYLTFLFLFSITATHAQMDTVLYEGFQFDIFADMDSVTNGTNTDWVNFDQDGLEPQFGGDTNKKWYYGEFFINALDTVTGETNYVATSLSFLQGFLPGNRNWLILPPIEVTDDSYMLHWESSPSQLPRYMDGYSVIIGVGSNDIFNNAFTDTIFQAASMDMITGNGQSVDYSNFTFTPGYLHADGGTLTDYFYDSGSGTIYSGLLEPHSVSLAAYEGQTIYIAFLHDSDDDDRMALDDVLVTKAMTINTFDTALRDLQMHCYPNPADHKMNLTFYLKEKNQVTFNIQNAAGQLMLSQNLGQLPEGNQQVGLHLQNLPAGTYFIQLQVEDLIATQSFIKK